MRPVVLGGAFGAVALGLTAGAALSPAEGEIFTGPGGPQLVYSQPREYASEPQSEGWWSVGSGPVGDWVFGTDWVNPEWAAPFIVTVYNHPVEQEEVRPIIASTPTSPREAYAPMMRQTYTVPSIHGGVRDVSVWRPEPQTQPSGEQGKVLVPDDERRSQVDHLAHRPDPDALRREPLAKGATFDRVVELDHPDSAEYAYVDDAR